jgi:hypothetical protein
MVIFCRRMAVPCCFFRTAIVFITIARVPVGAQNGTTAEPQFEVASVKPSAPGSRGPTIYNPTRDRFAITAITTKSLIAYAYDVRDFQVSGGPSWVGSEEYVRGNPGCGFPIPTTPTLSRSLRTDALAASQERASRRGSRTGGRNGKGRADSCSASGR